MTWFALYTEPQREAYARDHLKRCGYTVFYPHIPEWVGLSSNRARLRHRPYYPRYLFVDAIHDDQQSNLVGIWLVPGVIGPVRGTDQMPHSIAEERLQPLFDICDVLGAAHVPEAPKPLWGLDKGNKFKMAEGNPLWGLVATIEDVDGKHLIATIDGLIGRVMIAPDQVGEVLDRRKNGDAQPNSAAHRACA